jgi:RNA polymerase sigma-70 factor, ECF subfamily
VAGEDQTQDDVLDALFQRDGHYACPPAAWAAPDTELEQREFIEVMQSCIDQLPPRLARVFMMREWLEREFDEICAEVGVTANNASVMLFRARMRLRECMELRWTGAAP